MTWPTPARLEMRFRRRFLGALVEGGRLRAETRARFLAWSRSGFSVDATHRVAAGDRERAERLARYATRVVLATGKVRRLEGARVRVEPPPTRGRVGRGSSWTSSSLSTRCASRCRPGGGTSSTTTGCTRTGFAGNSGRPSGAPAGEEAPTGGGAEGRTPVKRGPEERAPEASSGPTSRAASLRRQAWARLLRKVFEVDPLLCPRCQETMEKVALILDPKTVDRILSHRRERGLESAFEGPPARAPPAAQGERRDFGRRRGAVGRGRRERRAGAVRPRWTPRALREGRRVPRIRAWARTAQIPSARRCEAVDTTLARPRDAAHDEDSMSNASPTTRIQCPMRKPTCLPPISIEYQRSWSSVAPAGRAPRNRTRRGRAAGSRRRLIGISGSLSGAARTLSGSRRAGCGLGRRGD